MPISKLLRPFTAIFSPESAVFLRIELGDREEFVEAGSA